MSKEAMNLALEALKQIDEAMPFPVAKLAQAALREALAEQPAQQDSTCSNALRIQHKAYPRTCKKCGLGPCVELAQQALDKMAENARELGLDYEPAQQEPVAYWIPKAEQFCIADPSGRPFAKAWEPLYTSPPTQRTWQGLTDDEMDDCWNKLFGTGNYNRRNVYRAIEAKLKEKNGL